MSTTQTVQPTDQSSLEIGNMHRFLKFLKMQDIDVKYILDVGAHECTWSKNCADVFPDANYYLVEPQSELENSLKQFCERHKGSKYLLAGLGEEKDERVLTVWKDKQGTSFRPSEINIDLKLEERNIKIETIDHLIETAWMPVPDLIKIDVQGYEENVIAGAQSVLGRTEMIIMEISMFNFLDSKDFVEMVAFMAGKGYVPYDFVGFNRRPHDNALGQVDVAFVRKDGKLRAFKGW